MFDNYQFSRVATQQLANFSVEMFTLSKSSSSSQLHPWEGYGGTQSPSYFWQVPTPNTKYQLVIVFFIVLTCTLGKDMGGTEYQLFWPSTSFITECSSPRPPITITWSLWLSWACCWSLWLSWACCDIAQNGHHRSYDQLFHLSLSQWTSLFQWPSLPKATWGPSWGSLVTTVHWSLVALGNLHCGTVCQPADIFILEFQSCPFS